jgi:thiosulfate dehydrogenase
VTGPRPHCQAGGSTVAAEAGAGRAGLGALVTLLLAVALGGCTRQVSAVERGAEVAADPAFSSYRDNTLACTTCHAVRAGESDRLQPGAPLAGATARPSYWGGAILDLFEAVSACYVRFMRGGRLDRDSDDARALYAWLVSLEPGPAATTAGVPFTVVRLSAPPAPGDATAGGASYARACAVCHGQPRTGSGRLGQASVLPEVTERAHPRADGYTEATLRQVFVQKIRSGGYLGFDGVMPPFSREVLTDADIANIISFLDPQLR